MIETVTYWGGWEAAAAATAAATAAAAHERRKGHPGLQARVANGRVETAAAFMLQEASKSSG
jgi:hypothetical protein